MFYKLFGMNFELFRDNEYVICPEKLVQNIQHIDFRSYKVWFIFGLPDVVNIIDYSLSKNWQYFPSNQTIYVKQFM